MTTVQKIQTPLMACLVKMLESELEIERFLSQVTSNGLIELNLPDLKLLDFVCTTLGVPEDNSLDYSDEEAAEADSNFFCRDYLYFKWTDVVDGKLSITEFILWAQAEHQTSSLQKG